MPIWLSQIGPPRQYPARGPQFRQWLFIWVACALVGAAMVLLLWPEVMPAHGPRFWLMIAGTPNVVFAVLFGIRRDIYETEYLRALYYNQHRESRRRELIACGQQPLRVLAYSYRFPLDGKSLVQTILEGPAVLRTQPLRDSSAVVRHTRLPDNDVDGKPVDPILAKVLQHMPLTPYGKLYAHLLAPLVNVLRELSKAEPGRLPVVRLVIDAANAMPDQLDQLRTVIHACGLPSLDCQFAHAAESFMLADAWLDAKILYPLLVVAVQLHTVPPPDSTEGGVTVLLVGPTLQLPDTLEQQATLHRPAAADPIMLSAGVATAIRWGKANADAIQHIWTTGFRANDNTLLATACRESGLTSLANQDAQHSPDGAIGYAGAAAGWLSIAAAVESGKDGPQLIMNRTENIQTAVLYATKKPSYENRIEQHAG